MNLRPSVFVGIDKWQECLYFLGDHFVAAPVDLQNTFLEALPNRNEAFATLDRLRVAYSKRIALMVDRINSMTQRMAEPEGLKEFCAQGWRVFTSNHFAAAALALSTPLPGVTVGFPNGAGAAVDDIATFQMLVWLCLCSSWLGDLEAGRTLESDLGTYVEPGVILDDAVNKFLSETEKDSEARPIAYHFCVEAVRASLCAWSGKPNPRLREWADLFVEQEIERRCLGEKSPPLLNAMEISGERARATIPYEELFDACVRQMGKDFRLRTQLGEIGEKMGYRDLGDELLSATRFQPKGEVFSVEGILTEIRASWKGGPPQALLILSNKLVELLGDNPSSDSLVGVAEGLKEILGDDPETRGRVEKWLCSQLYRNDLTNAMLERIGDKAQPWEQELTLEVRTGLWTERSNALRMCGRVPEALAVAEAVIADIEAANVTTPPELRRNLGILYREAGWYEEALDIFLKLLPDDPRNLALLNSLVATYGLLGLNKEVTFYLEAMVKLATGPHANKRPAIISNLAAAKAFNGQRREALALLREVNLDTTDDLGTLLSYASGWGTVLITDRQVEEEDRRNLENLIAILKHQSDTTVKNGNVNLNLSINRLLAFLLDLTKYEQSNPYWGLVDASAREFEGAPDPMAILAMARNAWADGLYEEGRNYLLELPSAVTKRHGQGHDTSLRIQSLSNLRLVSDIVAEYVIRSGSLEDVRLVAELTRDMLGRIAAASTSQKTPVTGFVAPSAANVGRLGGPTAVFEWVKGDDSLRGLATFIAADGTVNESYQTLPEIDLELLAERITQRLSLWSANRVGSPLDLEGWLSFENWLVGELEGRLPDGGRLVIIEHEAVAGLQWHVAAAPRWRVSYAPSWSALLSAREETATVRNGPIGLALVPKYRESPQNLESLESSVSRTLELTAQLGLQLRSALRETCDRVALMSVLEETTVAKVLCHGFVDPDRDIVALMVAHDGELPLGNSVAANTPSGRLHRFDWRDCQQLKSAPAVLFSAACSSGQSHHAGFGEKLGFFSTLRRAGTKSVVAPRWDIEPAIVLPILDNIMERYLRTDAELGEALHAACSEAGEALPRWQAWALALEGDWK